MECGSQALEEILFRFFHRVGFVFLYDLPGDMRLLDDGVLAFDKQADLVLVNLRGRVVLQSLYQPFHVFLFVGQ